MWWIIWILFVILGGAFIVSLRAALRMERDRDRWRDAAVANAERCETAERKVREADVREMKTWRKAEWLAEEWAASDRKEFNTGATAQQLLVAADLSTRGEE